MWAYLGLNDAKKKLRVRGVQSHFNPEVSGRFWLMPRNVLLHKDLYYTQIYHTMKYYYTYRQDMWDNGQMQAATDKQIEAERTVVDRDGKHWLPKLKGWRGHVDDMARRFVWKLLISHGVQIILESYGTNFPKHHNYMPPKPDDMERALRMADMFHETRMMLLERQNKYYAENGRIMIGKEVMADAVYDMGFS